MIGSAALQILKQRLGRGTNASSQFESWMLGELVAAQTRLEKLPETPSFLLTERSYIDVTEGEERVILPSDFLKENEDDDMQIEETTNATFTNLKKDSLDRMRRLYPTPGTGLPQTYCFQGAYFRIRPVPNLATYRMWMTYYATQPAPALEVENIWLRLWPDLLIAEAGIPLATTLRNEVALSLFSNMKIAEIKKLSDDETAKKEENRDPNPED